ncbi:MAG: sensor histidine kinase [Chloroflexi bacterium]|nr:sensor histidine kinase [Chloroflexota bacterium]
MTDSPNKAPYIDVEEEMRLVRPFFFFLTLSFIFMYVVSLYSSPELRQPARLIPFTLLLAVHTVLYWMGASIAERSRLLVPYIVVQGMFAFIITSIAREQGMGMVLYMALIGISVGLIENWKKSMVAVIGLLVIAALNFGLIWGSDTLRSWALPSLPMAIFVVIYVALFMRQANAREEAQRLLYELESAHQQLGEYAQQLETLTRDAERQRMARELHDTLAQGLAGLILQLEAQEAFLERGDSEAAMAITGQAKDRARAALANARRAIDDLRDQTAVSPLDAVSTEIERFTTATGIACKTKLPDELVLSPQIGEHLVRCVGEGLANVAQHAKADHVAVAVGVVDGRLHTTIHDDGIGFDVTNGAIPAGHYGLIGLRERARLANGTLTIESDFGEGTTLQMVLPLSTSEEGTA